MRDSRNATANAHRIPWLRATFTACGVVLLVGGLTLTAILIGDLLREISNTTDAQLRLESKANLVGAFVGSLVAGAISASAALGVVYVERQHRIAEERARLEALAKPVRHWCIDLARKTKGLIDSLQNWVNAPSIQAPPELFLVHRLWEIARTKCDEDEQNRIEHEFLHVKREFTKTSKHLVFLEVAGASKIEEAINLAQESSDRRAGLNELAAIFDTIEKLMHAVNRIYAPITQEKDLAIAVDLEARAKDCSAEASRQYNDFKRERKSQP